MPFRVPAVLLIAFNRPDTARRVFEAIRLAKPDRLFIACDGARPHKAGEQESVDQVRALARQVDWPCEVSTRFPETNLGCGRGVSSAIEWFLQEAGEGIILEDDCLPTPAFFRFSAVMLDRYRDDARVGLIAGSNMAPPVDLRTSYGFSRAIACWGWATWRRTWDAYKLQVAPIAPDEPWVRHMHPNTVRMLQKTILRTAGGDLHTWDYQLMVQLLRNNQLTAVPGQNLILNIGFDGAGTHFARSGRPWTAPHQAFNPEGDWSETVEVRPDPDYDRYYLSAGHRGSSKLYRHWLKWRCLLRRRFDKTKAYLSD